MVNGRFEAPKWGPVLVRDFGLQIVSSDSRAAHFLAPLWGPGRGSKMGPFLAPKHEAREWVQRLRHRWKFVRGRMPVQTIVPLDTMREKAGLLLEHHKPENTNPWSQVRGPILGSQKRTPK